MSEIIDIRSITAVTIIDIVAIAVINILPKNSITTQCSFKKQIYTFKAIWDELNTYVRTLRQLHNRRRRPVRWDKFPAMKKFSIREVTMT